MTIEPLSIDVGAGVQEVHPDSYQQIVDGEPRWVRDSPTPELDEFDKAIEGCQATLSSIDLRTGEIVQGKPFPCPPDLVHCLKLLAAALRRVAGK